eukprot:13336129-Ditylum_brightwellii.AAC.1
MVTELTKAAVKDVKTEMKDYMTNEIQSNTPDHTAPPQEISQGNHIGHQATGHITPNPPHGIPQR